MDMLANHLTSDSLQEALEKAYEADLVGDYSSAMKRYRVGLSAIEEGLKQNAPQTGLGPQYDNVAKWKKDISQWQTLVEGRYLLQPIQKLSQTGTFFGLFPSL